jgi:mannonate dehydratase
MGRGTNVRRGNSMNRREWISGLGLAPAAQAYQKATRGLPPLKITNVKAILTNPPYANGSFSFMQRLVIAKVETSEPGLYGLGCASFVFRPAAVADVIEKYLKPFVVGKNPDRVSDLFQSMHVSSLWRSGPVHNYAVGGIDMALWDIKGKRAGMPVWTWRRSTSAYKKAPWCMVSRSARSSRARPWSRTATSM